MKRPIHLCPGIAGAGSLAGGEDHLLSIARWQLEKEAQGKGVVQTARRNDLHTHAHMHEEQRPRIQGRTVVSPPPHNTIN